MVVLAASITTKSGKVLVSRQFFDMPRMRTEGLLMAFPKLVHAHKQHTFVETDEVRYMYRQMEDLYLLLVTNKKSNIIEDLDTLRLLSKLVQEYSHSLNEEGICKSAFELIFAFDEAISVGNKENVTVAQVKQYCKMKSYEEQRHKMEMQDKINETKDVMKRKAHEIEKRKIVKGILDKGGLMSISGPRKSVESSFSDMSISSSGSGFDSGPGFAMSSSADMDTSSKSKGEPFALFKAPPKGKGMQFGEGKKANQFLESLKAEGEVMLEDVHVPSAAQSKLAVVAATDPITLTIEERLNVAIARDGGLNSFDVQGALFLQVLNHEDSFIRLQIENKDIQGLSFKMHPSINKDLFDREHIIGLKDPNRPFPSGQNDVGLLKWRIQNLDESSLPLTVNCWPSVSGNDTYVTIEYEASHMFDLQNVVISIPLPAACEAPKVAQIDGEWRYDLRTSVLEWSVLLIDNSNRRGSMEFVVPQADASSFFPINIRFTAARTYSDVMVTSVNHLRSETAPKYTQRMRLITNSYQVV